MDDHLPAKNSRIDEWTMCLKRVRDDADAQQFAMLFGHFAPRVKAFLMKSGANEALAEETVQEAMATVWQKAKLFDPSKASASTWIYTIVRNKHIDAIRKQRRPEPEDLPWGQEQTKNAVEIIGTAEEEKQLRNAISALPEEQRLIIQKAYFGDLSHGEIAEVTGLPLGTIKSRIRLGLERLRHELKNKR